MNIFDAASEGSKALQNLYTGFLLAAGGVLALVIILTVYISLRFKERPNSIEPRQVAGNKKLEWAMVGVPFSLVVIFFLWSLNTVKIVMPPIGDHPPDIIITGHQWWWEAFYPGKNIFTANEIHILAGKPVLFQFKAGDVIHDWWVPSFGAKMDMIPGINNYLWTTILKPGLYDGACSEFCGQQHAWMRIRVVAQDSTNYANWLSLQSSAADTAGPIEKTGAALFQEASCSSCHTIRGTNSNGLQGPDLTHFASRHTMLAGMLLNNAENLERWLNDPQLVKPGAKMPRFIFGKDSVQALVAYLEKLK